MTTDVLAWANLTGKQVSISKYKNAHALRYDNVMRVLLDLEERACVPPKRERKARTSAFGIAELRAHVANLKAEHDRVIEKITDDLDALADRLADLEARAQRPFWRRALGYASDPPELAVRARRKLTAKLGSIFLDRTEAKPRSIAQLSGTGANR
jgi:uncharacterized coiled-coil protein SlyX